MSANRLILLLLLPIAACASAPEAALPERELRTSPPYQITLRPVGHPHASPDGFEHRFQFEVVSFLDLQRNSLVQELRQETILERKDGTEERRTFALVEAFRMHYVYTDAAGLRHYRMNTGVNDRHAMMGFESLPQHIVGVRVKRTMFIYIANVAEADFTHYGFAHLPHNEDGSVVTDAPAKFNAEYQEQYQTRGRIMHSADALGLRYTIHYAYKRNDGRHPSFRVEHGSGR